jgi:hypothetical protein
MNMVLQNRGEEYVKNFIAEVFARWGKTIVWNSSVPIPLTPALSPRERENVIQPVEQVRVALENQARECCPLLPEGEGQGEGEASVNSSALTDHEQRIEFDSAACDPMGAAIPKLNL